MPQITHLHGNVVRYPDVKIEAPKRAPTPRTCLLKILSWNIAGWAFRQSDPGILDYLRLHDIIAVQETWSIDNINLNGYLVLNSYAVSSSGKGCPKALMFSTALEVRVKWLPPCDKITQMWNQLELYITNLVANACVILTGDLNARTGSKNDILYSSNAWSTDSVENTS